MKYELKSMRSWAGPIVAAAGVFVPVLPVPTVPFPHPAKNKTASITIVLCFATTELCFAETFMRAPIWCSMQ